VPAAKLLHREAPGDITSRATRPERSPVMYTSRLLPPSLDRVFDEAKHLPRSERPAPLDELAAALTEPLDRATALRIIAELATRLTQADHAEAIAWARALGAARPPREQLSDDDLHHMRQSWAKTHRGPMHWEVMEAYAEAVKRRPPR
jgi:hypothetical protein